MDSKLEWLVRSLLNGETIHNFAPKSRLEEYLKAAIEQTGSENLPIPRSRIDALLYELNDEGGIADEVAELAKQHYGVKSTKSGTNISIRNLHEKENTIDVKLTSDTVTDFTGKVVKVKGRNLALATDVYGKAGGYKLVDVVDEETGKTRKCAYYKTNGVKYVIEGGFKENTQYSVSYEARSAPDATTTGNSFCFWYTDGTFDLVGQIGKSNYTFKQYRGKSAPEKTLAAIGVYWWDQNGRVYTDIDTFCVVEGADPLLKYEPYIEPVEYQVNQNGEVSVEKSTSSVTTVFTTETDVTINAKCYLDGKAEIEDSSLDFLKQRNGVNLFRYWSGKTVPFFNTECITSMTAMFGNATYLEFIPPYNTKNVTNMNSMFTACNYLKSCVALDTKKVTDMASMFSNCAAMKTIEELDMRSVTTTTNMFTNCSNITEIWLKNIKCDLQVGSGTSWGNNLTLECLLHLIKEMRNTGTALKLTVGSVNLEKLAGVYVKTIEITDEMRAEDKFIDEKFPFVQCESTDEGAMSIEDYTMLKSLTIQ